MTSKLYNELEKHEEWMQGNVKSGYTAIQFAGEPFPPVLIRRTQVRLPESGDILSAKENEVIQYAYSLRNLNCLEVSACDRARVEGCFSDFRLRGKLSKFSSDCDVLPLNVTNRNGSTARLDWFKGLKAQMNFQYVHEVRYFDGIICGDYKARGEMDPCYHDGRKAFRNTTFSREVLDIRRPDGQRVFLGAIDATGENDGKLQVYYFSEDANDKFVTGICGNLPMYVSAYLKHVKGYSARSISSILGACSDSFRLSANDYKWDGESRSIQPLAQINRLSFADKMAQRDMHFLLPEVLASFSKLGSGDKVFSDEAKQSVAKAFHFKNKPGFNPTPADAASCLSDNSHSSTGAQSNRSVTTQDIQVQMPELRTELHQLKEQLRSISPDDDLLDNDLMATTDVDQLSFGSNASAILAQLFKDTQDCIRLIKVRLGDLQREAVPPAISGSTGPSASGEASRGAVQGE